MSIVVVVTAYPILEHRAEVIEAFEEAVVHEGSDRLVMIEKYESAEARSEHSRGAPLADLRSALDGKLTTALDVQVLEPHPAGNAQKGAL